MKNLKQIIVLCAGIIMTGFITACSDFIIEPTVNDADTGNVLIKIAGSNGRTILPPAAVNFSRYELEVDGAGDYRAPADLSGITGVGVSMSLPKGNTYTFTVKAYQVLGGTEYLAAQGSMTETVLATHQHVVINLKPVIEGKGFFSYDINLPSEVTAATLNLKSGTYDHTFDLKTSAKSSAPAELDAGYYDMLISLTKGDLEAGEYAAVHIYAGQETAAVIDLNNAFALINLETLIEYIEVAEKELDNFKISASGSDVSIGLQWITQEQADALKEALETAQDLVENPPAKQLPVNEARQALEAALAALTPKYGTQFASQSWTTTFAPVAAAPHITTPITLNITSTTVWTLAIPFAEINLTNGTGANAQSYTKNNGVITFNKGTAAAPTAYATATLSPDGEELTVKLTLPASVTGRSILGGTDTFILRKGTAASPAADIEYLFSGVWTNPEGTPPRLNYISSNKWTFSLPFEGTKVNGTFVRYNRKAGFFYADGSFYGVGEAATEEAELVGNKLTVYPLEGDSFEVTLNPPVVPFVGNWTGGDVIDGTLYVGVPFWSLEDSSGVLVQGDYFWDGNEVYFISNGAYFATGTINEDKTAITVKVNSSVPVYGGLEQEFTLTPNPFAAKWKATILFIVAVNADVTNNVYTITSSVGNANGQYYWKNENGTRKAYFYSNGYSYGVATMNAAGSQISVVLAEAISGITTLTFSKQ